jgi:hypothetical protein
MTRMDYMVYCFQCNQVVALGRTRQSAYKKMIEHIRKSPHIFVSVLDRREAEEKGIPWPKGA